MAEITATPEGILPGKAGAKQKRNKWRTMVALSFGYFIDQGEAQAMSVLFPTLQTLWGLSLHATGSYRHHPQPLTVDHRAIVGLTPRTATRAKM